MTNEIEKLAQLQKNNYRFLYLGICIALFVLLWVEMAVGIFGSPLAGN